MNTFDELDKAVAPVGKRRKRKLNDDDSKRQKGKSYGTVGHPYYLVDHVRTPKTSCKAATLSREWIVGMKKRM